MLLPKATPTHKLGTIGIKHLGTFGLKELPVPSRLPKKMYVIDRWTPVADIDKDKISSLQQVTEGWIEGGGDVWFGFEGEGMIYPNHIYEYYNLIVLRPSYVGGKAAVDIVTASLELK